MQGAREHPVDELTPEAREGRLDALTDADDARALLPGWAGVISSSPHSCQRSGSRSLASRYPTSARTVPPSTASARAQATSLSSTLAGVRKAQRMAPLWWARAW